MLDEALFAILFDAALGVLQWLLIARFILGIFLPEDSRLRGMGLIRRITNPVIGLASIITHHYIINRVRPLYVGFLVLIIRFYILPTTFGYDIEGLAQLSIEAFVLALIAMI
jgi:hypothetical protein